MVARIDEELLRKRAEHNDGELSSLVEIALHQYDIEKIENLDVYCRNLEILFLQCNQISKIENLHKLKRLKYLQLALNNITVIENLSRCESLEKLDLTVNFIDDPLCVESLRENILLKELYLVGNPCTEKPGYRDYVITVLPQLKSLDGIEVTKSERIVARQLFEEIRIRFIEDRLAKGEEAPAAIELEPDVELLQEDDDSEEARRRREEILDKKRREFQTVPVKHTPQARLQAAKDLAAFRETKTPSTSKSNQTKTSTESILYGPDGRILQKNEGKWEFKFDETANTIVLTVQLSKFLDSSLIDAQVNDTYVRLTIKGKILQLTLDEAVSSQHVLCERSKLTGQLAITMLKASKLSLISSKVNLEDIRRAERDEADKKRIKSKEEELQKKEQEKSSRKTKRVERLLDFPESKKNVDYRNIVLENESLAKSRRAVIKGGIIDADFISADIVKPDLPFVDDPDVPPLC